MKVSIETTISILEASIGEIEHIIPSEVLESAIEYLKSYQEIKTVQGWIDYPEAMGR